MTTITSTPTTEQEAAATTGVRAAPRTGPRTVVITGAAGGIGTALVERFLADGDIVIGAGRDLPALRKAAEGWVESLASSTITAHVLAIDVADPVSVSAFAADVAALTDHVDVLINSAGYFPTASFEDMTLEQWQRVIDINLTGDFLVIKSLLSLMKASGRGRIINIGSGTTFVGTPGQAHYAAAKGGVLGLTRTLARELGPHDITVNFLTPGLTITPAAVSAMPEAAMKMQRDTRAIQRDEYPADVVGSAVFLASDDAAFMTGQTVNVDGGRYLVG
ncbi:SDR family NAD(P)-dependent oxidoreductase [uncultured Jatrophihabitans sp.]|uniref:SDR family NAD(P)-dependent oxidoreductase n=1 Tax=uncultured Jatrophihabitans sp. TaxID=1610747 RepID=UPI0035CB4FF1